MTRIFLSFVFILHIGFAVSCQSGEANADAILKPCFDLFDKKELVDGGKCIEKKLYENPTKAGELSEKAKSIVFGKCVKLKKEDDYKNAIICFEGIKELMPDSANVRFNLADSYYEFYNKEHFSDKDLLDMAEQTVLEGLAIKDNDVTAILLYAGILKTKGKNEKALEQYKKLVKLDAETSLFWTGLGLTQHKLQLFKESVESLEKAVSLDVNNAPAYGFLALSYEKLGEKHKASEAAKKALKLRPDDVEVIELLKRLEDKSKW